MPKASATSGVQLWRWIVPIAVGIIIWFLPVPAGLNPKAIHMLGIFLGTIAAILTNPMPSGAVMMTALAVSYFSGTLTLSQSLSGLASGTVWMIFSAYVLSLGFVQSGLGRRIAYLMLSKFGGSSTGIAYSLGCADLVMAPAMPSVTARSGVIISLAGGLTKLGFIKWMSATVAAQLVGTDWLIAFIVLGFAYIYLHYIFATASGHVAAMYVPFCAVAIGCGAPALMVAVCFGIFSNIMWGITEYAGGPGPIYFGQGYFERPRFYKINFCVVTLNVLLVFITGMAWWKLIGLY